MRCRFHRHPNKRFRFLFCVNGFYSKYAWVIPLTDKKGITVYNFIQEILKKSLRNPNKIWIDKDSNFYNQLKKSWLEKTDIEIYSKYNEGRPVVAERFIRTLKKIISIWLKFQNVYIDKLEIIVRILVRISKH